MENRREYIDKMDARLKELENEIRELGKIADKVIAEVKGEYQEQIYELFLKKKELEHKVTKVKKASGNAWEDMKAGAELSWEAFQDSVKRGRKKTL